MMNDSGPINSHGPWIISKNTRSVSTLMSVSTSPVV
ncbi:hypothetical protein PC116_g25342 [Phytophthora cactorum]|nr:hypothetical protein PC116_g25342 [Phytophthora cactorum]